MMNSVKRTITVAVCAALQDAGEATRSLEIVRGIRKYVPDGLGFRAVFLSHGGRFEQKILDSGFEIYKAEPQLEGVGFYQDLKPNRNNFVGSAELASRLIKGELAAFRVIRPDAVLYGFWPFASLARRMAEPEIPGICYLPLPLERNIYSTNLMKDIPDQIKPLTFLPLGVRRAMMKAIPPSVRTKAPIFRQQNILDAAKQCGWNGSELQNLFDLLRSDLTIVNDLPEFYRDIRLPSDFKITGPLYSQPGPNEQVSPEIEKIFQDGGKTKIFCTMGSSGRKNFLLEAVRAIAALPTEQYCAVILAPKAVCPLEEAQTAAGGRPNIYITDQFVPAKLVNALADIVVCHGGQGTVQTAMASGTPIVGAAMQPEQQINLDNVVISGAAVRIPVTRWNEKNIRSAVTKISSDPTYRRNAEKLAQSMASVCGKKESADAIWHFIGERCHEE